MTVTKRRPQKTNSLLDIIRKKYITIPLFLIVFIMILYSLLVFSSIPFIAYWRGIWIETAMTTADHQWLATAFIPEYIIDAVMSNKNDNTDIIGGGKHLSETTSPNVNPDGTDVPPDDSASNIPEPENPKSGDILGQKGLKVGDTDYAGNKININDIDEGILVSEVSGTGYRGMIMLIDDPSRVYLGTTTQKGAEGLRIKTMLETYGAVAGINASGFSDPNDSGTGGDIIGRSYSDGEMWGSYVNYYGSILLTSDNNLVVGNVYDWEKYEIRAGIQFGPVLIADGEAQIKGSGGYGIQPRTAIGQREDGVIVFLVIDGRNPGWSLGCTMGDLIEIFEKYGVVNAACCDGGSSSVLAYGSDILNKNSSLNPEYGRRLPNAFLVAPKETKNDG